MFTFLKNLVGGKSAARAAKPLTRQAKPQLEALDQRLLPSTIPNLQGVTLHLDGPVVGSRQLQIVSETDRGNGTGTFQAVCRNTNGLALVNGTITLKHAGNDTVANKSDFGLTYIGVGPSYWGGIDIIQGSGDFQCAHVNAPASAYTEYTRSFEGPTWSYSGWDTEVYNFFNYGYFGASHSDADWQSAILW
jgi:hypothetical protein